MNVACVDDQCPEHAIPKTVTIECEIEEIRCGACGGPVEVTGEETEAR